MKQYLNRPISKVLDKFPVSLREISKSLNQKKDLAEEIEEVDKSKKMGYYIKTKQIAANHVILYIDDITLRKKTKKSLEKKKCDYLEPLKEFSCLYRLSKISEQHDLSLGNYLSKVIEFIPRAFRFPDLAFAKITFNGKNYQTGNFKETEWNLTTKKVIQGANFQFLMGYSKKNSFCIE
ncbi:MAG: hypothetical protein GF383_15495, partial [Candidatus Lokiarchaeota archaeon]|nr:hypothetical protein [Candidatus Lokiarchaeota archaeon]